MEGNKDEAEKCILLAETFIRQGHLDKAVKYLKKADKLYPSQRAKDLLDAVMQGKNTPNGSAGGEKAATENGEANARRRRSSGGRTPAADADYTAEQLESVRRIKSCKDYYEILEVSKDCTDSDLKKQYRKLALQFHPDKNKAPGATEAFKAIGNAYAVLSDPEKRKQYDLYGSDEARRANVHTRHHYENGYDPRFEADITAEELFNMFFGGGFPSNNVYVRRGRGWTRYANADHHHHHASHHHHHHETSSYSVLLQVLPILLVILVSMMSNFLSSDPTYTFQYSPKYPIEKRTANLRVPYYVKTDFAQEYQGSLHKLEQTIEAEYVTTLKQNCYRERNYKESLLWQARNFGDQRRLRKAQDMRMPSCESLQALYTPS